MAERFSNECNKTLIKKKDDWHRDDGTPFPKARSKM